MTRTPKTDAFIAACRRRGVEVLEHEDWGAVRVDLYNARLDTRPHALLPGKPVDTVWHHITVTFDHGPLVGEFKADLRKVEAIGVQRFGSGISYNILIDANAPRPRIAIGQFLEAKGTHTVNDKNVPGFSHDQNLVSVAVAFVGMPGDVLNEHAIEAIVQAEAALIEVGACTTTYDCVPHSLVAFKDCPTDALRDLLPRIRTDALAAAAKPPRTILPVRHRIVSTNLFVKNPAPKSLVSGPLAGLNRIVARVKAAFRFPPDVIACQEAHPHLAELRRLEGYQTLVDTEHGQAGRELAVLLRDGRRLLDTEFHHAADGVPELGGAFDHPRGVYVVKCAKRRRKVAVVNTHMGLIRDETALAEGKTPGEAAAQHARHAQLVLRIARRLERNGYTVFVCADANSKGIWSKSLPAVLVAAGMKVTLNRVDLVACWPKQARAPKVAIVDRHEVGSDTHDAVAISATERRRA